MSPTPQSPRIPPETVTAVVEKVFCRAGNSRFGPYELRDRGSEQVRDLLYSYRAKDASGLSVGLQVYAGLTRSKDGTRSHDRLAGSLWEQEVRLLLRLGARRHPAMPAVLGGDTTSQRTSPGSPPVPPART